MAAPAFASAGAPPGYSTRTSTPIPVPSGVTNSATTIVIVGLYLDNTVTVTPPLDFAEAPDSPMTNNTVGGFHIWRIYWRRPSAADAGNYNFTHSSTGTDGWAARFTGCVASGSPFDVTNSAVSVTAVSTTPAVSDTTTVADTLLVWSGFNYNGMSTATLAGFTEHFDVTGMALQSKAQAAAGATGSLTSAFSGPYAADAWLGALKPTAGGPANSGGMFFQT